MAQAPSKNAPVVVLGVPFDSHSSFRRGPADGPGRIREAFYSRSANLTAESGRDLSQTTGWHFEADLAIANRPDGYLKIADLVGGYLDQGHRLICLGGDHSITYPILKAHHGSNENLTVVQIDAHPDLYDTLDDNPLSHACPFARIMEDGLAGRLVQIGIRTMTPHQRAQADRFGVEVIDMREFHKGRRPDLTGPVYLSLDLDALDPAFAPGVSHHEPGGLTTRELLTLLQNLPGTLIGADIVEYNPDRDWLNMTAMAAAKILKELLDRLIA